VGKSQLSKIYIDNNKKKTHKTKRRKEEQINK
jgi:hypothetical protein